MFLVDPAVLQDVAGNHAEQAVLELVLNDKEKPSIAVRQDTNTNVQAGDPGCTDTDFEMFESTAKDNIGGDLTNDLKYTIVCPDGQLLVTGATPVRPARRVTRSCTRRTAIDGFSSSLSTSSSTACSAWLPATSWSTAGSTRNTRVVAVGSPSLWFTPCTRTRAARSVTPQTRASDRDADKDKWCDCSFVSKCPKCSLRAGR